MNTLTLDPKISEFATQQEADEYEVWFQQTVQAALNDETPNLPHDEVVARARERINQMMNELKAKS